MAQLRYPEIDFLRGIAIIMMAAYHFVWDLNHFGVYSSALYSGFWGIFQTITAGMFITIVGVSLALSCSISKRKNNHYIVRGLKIFSWGLIITAGSYLFMPEAFVFFGILHFIGISIIIASFSIRFRYLNLVLGVASLLLGICLQKFVFSFPWLVWLGMRYPISTLDLYPILPWIGLVFLGMFSGSMIYPKGKRIFRIKRTYISEKMSYPVRFLGKHAFLIYFLHLPLMFGMAWVVSLLRVY